MSAPHPARPAPKLSLTHAVQIAGIGCVFRAFLDLLLPQDLSFSFHENEFSLPPTG